METAQLEEVMLRSVQRPADGSFIPSSSAPSPGSLYVSVGPLLRRVATGKYAVPESDADELVNDVFATYLTNPEPVHDPRRYLIGGICNASREYWRERRREVPIETAESICADSRLLDGLPERLAVAATLARLREKCREIIRRYYFDEEATQDIAIAMDTTPANVLYRLFACRRIVRRIYQELSRIR